MPDLAVAAPMVARTHPVEQHETRSFYLIRHGATELNRQNAGDVDRIRGWKDVPLSDKGVREAEQMAKRLASSGIEVLVSSDFQRTRHTAAPIAETTGALLILTQLLRPWNVGIYTGQSSNEVHPELKKLAEKQPNVAPPEGESFNTFKARVFEGLRHAFASSQGKKLGVVTHHRVERLINGWLAKGQPADLTVDFKVMFKHGEDPGTAQKVKVDLAKLADAHAPLTSLMGEDFANSLYDASRYRMEN